MFALWNKALSNAPLLIIITFFSVLLEGCSVLGIRTTNEALYQVEKKVGNIEIRRYEASMMVETYSNQSDFREATDQSFRRLFDYISGANISSNDIAMTAPVIAEPQSNEGKMIAVTSPVIASPTYPQSEREGWRLKFVLPSSFTVINSPNPTDPLVRLVEVPEKLVAAISYSGLWSERTYQEQASKLSDWLAENNYSSISLPSYAGYDPPWALPFLRRNEVLIDVRR